MVKPYWPTNKPALSLKKQIRAPLEKNQETRETRDVKKLIEKVVSLRFIGLIQGMPFAIVFSATEQRTPSNYYQQDTFMLKVFRVLTCQ